MKNNQFSLINKININLEYNKVIKRNMLTTLFKKTSNQGGKLIQRNYARYTINEPEIPPKSPEALTNNPPVPYNGKVIRHKNVHLFTYKDNECNTKECEATDPCVSSPGTLKSVGHITSGNPKTKQGKVKVVDKTNIKGESKEQKVVIYNQANETNPTPEAYNGKGTSYLHDKNNPQRLQSILDEVRP